MAPALLVEGSDHSGVRRLLGADGLKRVRLARGDSRRAILAVELRKLDSSVPYTSIASGRSSNRRSQVGKSSGQVGRSRIVLLTVSDNYISKLNLQTTLDIGCNNTLQEKSGTKSFSRTSQPFATQPPR
jgi:hypothetical protein